MEDMVLWFVPFSVASVIAGVALYSSRDAGLKKRVHPWLVCLIFLVPVIVMVAAYEPDGVGAMLAAGICSLWWIIPAY